VEIVPSHPFLAENNPLAVAVMSGREPPPPPSKSSHKATDKAKGPKQGQPKCVQSKEQTSPTSVFSSADAGAGFGKLETSPRNKLPPLTELVLRSCETDPSIHQLEIPSPSMLLMHARICAAMENNSTVAKDNFSFNNLVGLSRMSMEALLSDKGTRSKYGHLSNNARSTVRSLLESADDLIVEGYFHEHHKEHGDIEVAIFSTQKKRQFIVCYRGSKGRQIKPVSSKGRNLKQGDISEGISHLSADEQSVLVAKNFCDVYFFQNIEAKIFLLLEHMSTAHPFCDVCFTGYSFGSALATIASVRYAGLYPMMTVLNHGFGAPRVGNRGFKYLSHSLPNLKIVRVEHGADPFVHMPEASNAWSHVGHTVTIGSDSSPDEVRAYRFDKRRPGLNLSRTFSFTLKSKRALRDHEIRSYVHAIERFTHTGLSWITCFVGEEGKGVNGDDNEARWVV